jgi:hypothetical protein
MTPFFRSLVQRAAAPSTGVGLQPRIVSRFEAPGGSGPRFNIESTETIAPAPTPPIGVTSTPAPTPATVTSLPPAPLAASPALPTPAAPLVPSTALVVSATSSPAPTTAQASSTSNPSEGRAPTAPTFHPVPPVPAAAAERPSPLPPPTTLVTERVERVRELRTDVLRPEPVRPTPAPIVATVAHPSREPRQPSVSVNRTASDRDAIDAPAPPTVRVTIGRIDVRAVAGPAGSTPVRPASDKPVRPRTSLDDYLKQRATS